MGDPVFPPLDPLFSRFAKITERKEIRVAELQAKPDGPAGQCIDASALPPGHGMIEPIAIQRRHILEGVSLKRPAGLSWISTRTDPTAEVEKLRRSSDPSKTSGRVSASPPR